MTVIARDYHDARDAGEDHTRIAKKGTEERHNMAVGDVQRARHRLSVGGASVVREQRTCQALQLTEVLVTDRQPKRL